MRYALCHPHSGRPARPQEVPIDKLRVAACCLAAVLVSVQAPQTALRPAQAAAAVVRPLHPSLADEPVQWSLEPPERAAPLPRALEPAMAAALTAEPPVPAPAPVVIASYFGPGLYGNRTACGSTLTHELIGVAHRTLPCGTPVTLAYGTATITVPVVDRGPFIYSREFDLTYATKMALGCSDLCRVLWSP